jgi:anoctamin-8
VTQFSTAFPLAPFLSCLSNIIEIRGDAYKLCKGVRRPCYRPAEDIGTFDSVFFGFGVIAVSQFCPNCGRDPQKALPAVAWAFVATLTVR